MNIFENNVVLRSVKFLVWDVLLDVVRAPVWWYTGGVALAYRGLRDVWLEMEKRMSLKVWMKHLFTPMYGMRDWQSRIISFFVRLVMLVWKLFVVVLFTFLLAALLVGWLLLPVAIVYGFLLHGGVFLGDVLELIPFL